MQGAGGVGGLLAVNTGAVRHYPTYDGNGNVSEYLTSTGATAAHFEYDPFGNTVVNTDSANLFTYRFSTKPRDRETGLYYYGYRYYDLMIGRWLSRDPVGDISFSEQKNEDSDDQVNFSEYNAYVFVENCGVSNIDILGLETSITVQRNKPSPGQQARDAPGTMTVTHNGKLQFTTPVNQSGYQPGSHGVYPGKYNVKPRTDYKPGDHFPNGQPGLVAPGQTNSGDAGHGYHNVYIHPKGNGDSPDSRGCQTIDSQSVEKIKKLMEEDKKKGEETTITISNGK
jgi:RHS repeat-associated protein